MVNALPSGLAVPGRAAANLKRALVLALPIGAVGLIGLALLGHPLAGLFLVIGLGFGAFNTRLVQVAVARYGVNHNKGGFVAGTLTRLGLLTVAALVAVWLVKPDGAGLLAGIAIFQVIILVSSAIPVMRELRK